MRKPKAYAAGPLGFSEAGKIFHNTVVVPLLENLEFDVLDPWKLTHQEVIDSALKLPYGQERKERWREVNKIIGLNNRLAIEGSDVIIAVLDGVDVDSGTAAEIGYGAALNKTIIGYRGDFRLSSENEGSIVNIQVEYFIVHRSGGKIVTSIDSLKSALIVWRNFWLRIQSVKI